MENKDIRSAPVNDKIFSRHDLEEAQKAGIREVVEWGDNICMEHGMRKKRRCDKCWQAKLKEWGVKDG